MLNKLLTTVLFTALSATAFAQGASDAKTTPPVAAKPAQVAPAADKAAVKVEQKVEQKVEKVAKVEKKAEHKAHAKSEPQAAAKDVAKEATKDGAKDAAKEPVKVAEPVKQDLNKAIQEHKAATGTAPAANPFTKPAPAAATK